jgi:hypothetical protein
MSGSVVTMTEVWTLFVAIYLVMECNIVVFEIRKNRSLN